MDEEIQKLRELLNPLSGEKSYFDFEEDFVEENIRCIPMIVRFKMDAAGIKLKLSEWSRFKKEERIELALRPCGNADEAGMYNKYLASLIKKHTGSDATVLEVNNEPAWANLQKVPELLQQKAKEFNWNITSEQWGGLTNLQRFTLTKLCRPGHENKNFAKAIKEFGLVKDAE